MTGGTEKGLQKFREDRDDVRNMDFSMKTSLKAYIDPKVDN